MVLNFVTFPAAHCLFTLHKQKQTCKNLQDTSKHGVCKRRTVLFEGGAAAPEVVLLNTVCKSAWGKGKVPGLNFQISTYLILPLIPYRAFVSPFVIWDGCTNQLLKALSALWFQEKGTWKFPGGELWRETNTSKVPALNPQRAPQPLVTELNPSGSYSTTGQMVSGRVGRQAGRQAPHPPSHRKPATSSFPPPQAEHLQRSPSEVVGAGRRRGWGLKGNWTCKSPQCAWKPYGGKEWLGPWERATK